MSWTPIAIGAAANDGTGTNWRECWDRINDYNSENDALRSRTISASDIRFDSQPTTELKINAAVAQALAELASYVIIPAFMLPYDITQITNLTAFHAAGGRLIREGGNAASYDALAYGAAGATPPTSPSVDATASIQAALDSGHPVDLCGMYYLAHGLSQSANQQVLYSSTGVARIIKNANGDLFTSSGDTVQVHNVQFWGDAATPVYTGHNVVASGNNFSLINCGSRRAYARAVKATGGHTQILGTSDIYQTADASASGYDIELGISGTATLYHELHGIYSSQAAGGILLTDTGSVVIVGGEFGKLTIAAGTLPAGVNGGTTVGARILGNVGVDISSALFTGCQFGAVTITFGAGTSNCTLGLSNTIQAGGSVVNNGQANNIYVTRGTAAGAIFFPGNIELANNKSLLLRTAAGGTSSTISASASDNLAITSAVSGKSIQYSVTTGGLHQMVVNGVEVARFDGTATATQTRFLVYDVDKAALSRVTVGANDSGGAGFKLLRVPN